MENGAISDRDETQGEEYEAKKKSPIKDGTRLTSAVSMIILELLMCADLLLTLSIKSKLSPASLLLSQPPQRLLA